MMVTRSPYDCFTASNTMNNVIEFGSKATAVIGVRQPRTKDLLSEMLSGAGYVFTVTTRYRSGTITAAWADSPRRNAKRCKYDHSLSPAENHLECALAWLDSLDNGHQQWKLVGHTSTSEGYVFTFA